MPGGGGAYRAGMSEQVTLRGENGLQLVADVYGATSGAPALFFHGSGQTRQSWGHAAEALAEHGWRVYTVDHRGHGDSERSPEGAYEHADVAKDVAAICAELDRDPLIIGASLGGGAALVAQGLAEPPRYRGLVLVDIAPTVDMAGARRIVSFMAANPNGFATLEEASQSIGEYRGAGKGGPSPAGLTRVLRQGDDERWRWHWDPRLLDSRRAWLTDPQAATAAQTRLRTQMLAGAHRLQAPTLLVRGGSSDVVTPEAARELIEAIPHARYVDVTDAGHMVAGDRNDAFTHEVMSFAGTLTD